MRIYFARHGESEANLLREFSNRGSKHPLTQRGREQMATLAANLSPANLEHIYSSPLLRARESARIVSEALSLPVTVSEALVEWDVGILEGRRDDIAWQAYWDLRRAWLDGDAERRIQGGESLNEIRARFSGFIADLLRTGTHTRVLVVAHGGLYAAALPGTLSNVTPQEAEARTLDHAQTIVAESEASGLVCLDWPT